MKAFALVVAILTGLLLLSTMICGLWIRAKHITDVSSINFHVNIGIATVIFGLIAIVLLIILAVKR